MRKFLLTRLWLPTLAVLPLSSLGAEEEISFNRQVLPILSDRCFACHGPDKESREAGMRLDVATEAYAERDGVCAIVPGKPEESEILHRILSDDPNDVMPPPESKLTVTKDEAEVLRKWIAQGAEYETHWAFVPPERPVVPELESEWPANEIDRFILRRLSNESLEPSPRAEKATLIRRVFLDLIGLPPTPEEVDAFVADDSPDTYERIVDDLLARPAFGERMALFWLDPARYADTNGYSLDNTRHMWIWRDWVIEAFNKNLPYDKFLKWQIAGDMVPDATTEQKVATGFARNHPINFEGGIIPEEFLVEYVADRSETTATVMLGLTMACARCHDHKYDPISQEDYFRFFAFFNNVPEKGLDGRGGNSTPTLRVPTDEQEREIQRLERVIGELSEKTEDIQHLGDQLKQALTEKEGWATPKPETVSASNGPTSKIFDDNSILFGGPNPEKTVYEVTLPASGRISLIRLELIPHESLPNGRVGRAGNANAVLSEFEAETLSGDGKAEKVAFALAAADHSQQDGDFDISNAIDGQLGSGWGIEGHNREGGRVAVFLPERQIDLKEGGKLRLRLRHESQFGQHAFGRIRLAYSDKGYVDSGDLQEQLSLSSDLQEARKQLEEVRKQVPTTMVMREMDKPRETYLLTRGAYDQPNKELGVLQPDIPESLGELPEGAPRNRLGLANWLVSEKNPLTSRVAVNRFWEVFFGHGIVKTQPDFGTQGERPTHPDLLDWLAVEFMDSGWNTKALLKKMVMTAAYQQTSRVTPGLLEKDPENRLYARGPRFRLQAEMIRDQALAASGLLVDKIGGPPVKPYQPPGLWKEVGYPGFDASVFVQDHGDKLYRRSMYTFWKRTSPPPALSAFDAPEREFCIVRRSRTNTPLQALVVLNDATYVEAARVLAERVMTEGGDTAKERIAYAFKLTTAMEPTEKELNRLLAVYEQAKKDFEANPTDAAALISVGEDPVNEDLSKPELAALTLTTSAILNLSRVVTRG